MRPLSLFLSIAVVGCAADATFSDSDGGGGASVSSSAATPEATRPSRLCARYVGCLTDPAAIAAAEGRFGEGAACWRSGDAAAEVCDEACRASALGLAGCGECDDDADCDGQTGARVCIAGVCAPGGCRLDPSTVDGVSSAACACNAAACSDEAGFLRSLADAAARAACGPAFEAWARCEATSLVCRDGRVDLYAACDDLFEDLAACQDATPGAPCP